VGLVVSGIGTIDASCGKSQASATCARAALAASGRLHQFHRRQVRPHPSAKARKPPADVLLVEGGRWVDLPSQQAFPEPAPGHEADARLLQVAARLLPDHGQDLKTVLNALARHPRSETSWHHACPTYGDHSSLMIQIEK